jgi:hypothetical protein
MATITQDMRFRLSLIKYADKYGGSKAAAKYKTNRQYIYAGNAVMTAPSSPCVISPEGRTTTLTSIPQKKSNSFLICADVTPMQASPISKSCIFPSIFP